MTKTPLVPDRPSADVKAMSVAELCDFIEAHDFASQGGPLFNNVPWIELSERLGCQQG